MYPELSWWALEGTWQWMVPWSPPQVWVKPPSSGDAAGLTFKFKSDPFFKSPGNSIRLPGYIKGKANLYLEHCWTSSETTSVGKCAKLSLYALGVFKKSFNFSLLQCICFLSGVNFSPVNSHEELWKVEFSLSLDFANRFCSDQWGCSQSVTPHKDGKGMRINPSYTESHFQLKRGIGGTAWKKIL